MTTPTAAMRRLVLALTLTALAGCADSPVLDLLGGGAGLPPADAPAPLIRRAAGGDAAWPNLASVPPRPEGVRSPAERQALMDRLSAEREEAETVRRDVAGRAPAPVGIPRLGGEVPPAADRFVVPAAPPEPGE